MAQFSKTYGVGLRAEGEVRNILKRYTKFVYDNVRIETLFTKNGFTEIDILAAVSDVILVIEVKNIKSIEGAPTDGHWILTGAEAGEPYSALNVLTQNRIHLRAFKNAWFEKNGELPLALPVTVVMNGCHIPEGISKAGVLTIQDFEWQVAELVREVPKPTLGYALQYFVGDSGAWIERPGLH